MNKELYNKTFKLPPNILSTVQSALMSTGTGNGVKRAKYLLKNGNITYQNLKRLKNYFDYFDPTKDSGEEYNLAGGNAMKEFIDVTLGRERNAVDKSKEIKQDMSVDVNQGLKPEGNPRLNEADEEKDVKQNALGIIVNKDNKILLLKRVENPEIWQPGKWSLVGGGIEDGEKPSVACQREIKEETDLDIDKFIHSYDIQRNPDSAEHVFVARYNGDDHDIELDKSENTHYGWYSPQEMKFLDRVPNLIDYVNLAFKKYD
jgi:8-oxo-dGTP pyrophosphatase MutT (NUDIX family)